MSYAEHQAEHARELARIRAAAARTAPRCPKCHGAGNLDRGNGTTKPCDCPAGLRERARRRLPRKAAKSRR